MGLYEDLGVSADATPEEIKAAHRKGVKKHHPDQGGDREKFDKVQRAYLVLVDPEKRHRYDSTGQEEQMNPEALLRARAFTHVATKLNNLVQAPQIDPRYTDIVVAMREAIQGDIQTVKGNIAELKQRIERVRQFQRRLKRKPDQEGADMLAQIFEGQINQLSMAIAQGEDELKVASMSKELVAEYIYSVDKQQAIPMGRPGPFWPGATGIPW